MSLEERVDGEAPELYEQFEKYLLGVLTQHIEPDEDGVYLIRGEVVGGDTDAETAYNQFAEATHAAEMIQRITGNEYLKAHGGKLPIAIEGADSNGGLIFTIAIKVE